ncbi:UNVERIFIED_CONTAM: hypothetical protein PYX00_003406 [Menopon gallinae]|uniref:Uncharacterized protein n=1 Tax=Menopon gallinae TaxID=328185 RepID=A0AAW2HZQ6_9NEOP
MDAKKPRKEGESHKFMEKFFTRLKMTKHTNEVKASDSKRLSPSSSTESKPLLMWDQPKITADNMMQFSDQLQQLLESLQEMKEVTFYTYDYPNQLTNKLEKEAMELRNLYRDVRAAAIDIDRLKKQRQVIKKEKSMAQKRLDKLREEELKELESIINVYAKPLFCKWESIKNTHKPEVLENFMNEVTGKYTAMEILQELIKRKLAKLSKKQSTSSHFILKKNISSANMANKSKNQDRTTSNWNITNQQDSQKAATHSNERQSKTSAERDILRVNRRKRQRETRDERRRQNVENIHSTTNNDSKSTGLDLQLVPIQNTVSEESEEVVPISRVPTSTLNSRPPLVSIEYTSDDDSALFGEIRQIPQLNYGGRNRVNNSGNDLRPPRTASH